MKEYSILLDSVTKTYNNTDVFTNLSFGFEKTGLYVILGNSGSGKTTLLKILTGSDADFKGKLTVNGSISVMFQEHRLFSSLNAVSNITYLSFSQVCPASIKDAENMLSKLGFSDEDYKKYPDELSGGMKQRVSFARAVLKKSDILILDEPFKEIDPELKQVFSEIISEQSRTRTVIITAHSLPENMTATGIIEL